MNQIKKAVMLGIVFGVVAAMAVTTLGILLNWPDMMTVLAIGAVMAGAGLGVVLHSERS